MQSPVLRPHSEAGVPAATSLTWIGETYIDIYIYKYDKSGQHKLPMDMDPICCALNETRIP